MVDSRLFRSNSQLGALDYHYGRIAFCRRLLAVGSVDLCRRSDFWPRLKPFGREPINRITQDISFRFDLVVSPKLVV